MFEPLKWQDEYSVGIKEIDNQHMSLLMIINKLMSEQEDEFKAKQFSETIPSLIHYAYTHFATEERYMAQANFPDQQNHILEHIDFIMKVLSLAMKAEDGSREHRLELLRFLKTWFSLHVLGIDRQYIPYLTAK
jgi:hemerythrin-like metal-binding protein